MRIVIKSKTGKDQMNQLKYLLLLFLLLCLPLSFIASVQAFQVREDEVVIRLSFLGDCVIGGEEWSRKKENSFDKVVQREGDAWPFSGVKHLLDLDDLSIINLEGALKDDTKHKTKNRQHWFRGATDLVSVLTKGGVEMAGLANNHAKDYGNEGLISTRLALRQAGILSFGYEELRFVDIKGIRLGFSGIRETTWRHHRDLPQNEIAKLKEAGCDYIVYTIHAGKEYSRQQNDLQTEMARAIIDAGANLVVGSHPHVVQGIEHYKEGLILYSLGNFIFGGNLKLKEFEGLIAQVELRFDQGGLSHTALNLIPVLTTGARPDNDFRPIPAKGEDAITILRHVQAASQGLSVMGWMHFPVSQRQLALSDPDWDGDS